MYVHIRFVILLLNLISKKKSEPVLYLVYFNLVMHILYLHCILFPRYA